MNKVIAIIVWLSILPYGARAVGPTDSVVNWRVNIFYFSKTDTRIFPPKPNVMGWMVNFANPLSIAALMVLLGTISWIAWRKERYIKKEESRLSAIKDDIDRFSIYGDVQTKYEGGGIYNPLYLYRDS
ncbi:MAG: hypothetical protein P4L41_06415 [Flavipsychrobacter sp.]|nr:hypothetical protein [Flavipsychrobacter sp.]